MTRTLKIGMVGAVLTVIGMTILLIALFSMIVSGNPHLCFLYRLGAGIAGLSNLFFAFGSFLERKRGKMLWHLLGATFLFYLAFVFPYPLPNLH